METIKINGKTFTGVPSVKLPTETDRAEFIALSNLIKEDAFRYDAELIQSYNGYYHVVADEGITIPAYSTTAHTIVAAENLEPKITLDYTNYDYYIVEKLKSIPEYSVTTLAKGRQEYSIAVYLYEVVTIPANTIHALIDRNEKITSRNVGISGKSYIRDIYYSSASAIAAYAATSYGIQQVGAVPTISSGVMTVKRPSVYLRGHATYLSSTFYNALTDMRAVYDIDVYRAPKANMNIDGWGADHIVNKLFESM